MSKNKNLTKGIWDENDLIEKARSHSQWYSLGNGAYKTAPSTISEIPSGVYQITLDNRDDTPILIKNDVKTDDIIEFSNSIYKNILEEISLFWKSENDFKKLGFLHRRGYLFYGKQGTGKSSLIQQIVSGVVKNGGIVFYCDNPKFLNLGLDSFRAVEPNRKIVCIFEDIDSIIKKHGDDVLLSILDGSNMVDSVLNIATTNYPELLDKRIISRPRRFDRVIKIEVPDSKTREEFLSSKLNKKDKIKDWVKKTNGLTFASMTEAIISVKCLGNELDQTIKILTDIENGHPSSEDFGTKGSLGFSSDSVDADDDDDVGCSPSRD